MRRALIYSLSAALLLVSLSACNQPQDTRETDQSEPTQAATSTPEQTTTPEQLTERTGTTGTEGQELSGDALISYFQRVYDIISEFHSAETQERLIQEELRFLADLCESDGEKLPADYEAQYRAWRPEGLPADIQNQEQQQTGQAQEGNQQQAQPQNPTPNPDKPKPSDGQTQGQQTQQSQTKPTPSPSPDLYQGFGSYEALIDAICKDFPNLSREEIIRRNPDPAGIWVDEEQAARDAEKGLLNNGG